MTDPDRRVCPDFGDDPKSIFGDFEQENRGILIIIEDKLLWIFANMGIVN